MPNGSTLKPYQKYHRKIIITTKAIKKNLARGGTSSKKKPLQHSLRKKAAPRVEIFIKKSLIECSPQNKILQKILR